MVLDHLMIKVKDWPKAKAYYQAALKPLGYTNIMDGGTLGGFGVGTETAGRIFVKQDASPGRVHFAIRAPSAEAVQQFHDAAIAAGGTDNGAPGPRGHYSEGGIGCFVSDVDDNNVEVVFQT